MNGNAMLETRHHSQLRVLCVAVGLCDRFGQSYTCIMKDTVLAYENDHANSYALNVKVLDCWFYIVACPPFQMPFSRMHPMLSKLQKRKEYQRS